MRSLHEKKEHMRLKKWRNFGQKETKNRAREVKRENQELYADFLEEDTAHLKLR